MTRSLITKLVVVALAIASLGLASTASAADPMPNGAAPADPAAPAQPAQPVQPAQPDQGAQGAQEGPEQADEQTKKSKEDELFERFQKECPNGEFSPGQFCKDFARGKFNTKPPTAEERDRFKRFCNMKDAEPSHSDKAFCEMYRRGDFGCDEFVTAPKCKHGGKGGKGGNGGSSSNGNGGYDGGSYNSPVKKAEKVLNKELPFTGLEIWQLGLLGLVLSAGGIGVRRLLAS
jgi:hypothetical protein